MNSSQKGLVGGLVLVIVLALLAGGGVYWLSRNQADQVNITPIPPTPITTSLPEAVPTPAAPIVENPWSVVEQMKVALQNHNLETVKKLSYKPFPPCPDATTCNQLMDFLSGQVKNLKLADFINQWSNERQAVFTTMVKIVPGAQPNYQTASYNKIFFVKDQTSQEWKLLLLGMSDSFSDKNEADVQQAMVDSDQDGVTDRRESCLGASQYDPKCEKTDPTKRDTDGDGWWDGIDAEMNR